MVLHGYLRTTLDLDLVLHLEDGNVERALKALADLGFQPQVPVPLGSFADPQARETWFREKNMTVFSLWHLDHPAFAVDLFVREPFDFEAVYRRALRVPLRERRSDGRVACRPGGHEAGCRATPGPRGHRGTVRSDGGPGAMSEPPETIGDGWDFDGARRHHSRRGLRLTPAQRLQWLEETVEEMRRLQGLARQGRRVEDARH